MSKKRILPAFILAGTVGFLGLHRFYAGRPYTALAQLITFSIGAAMLWKDLASLLALHTLDDYMDWSQTHSMQPIPWFLVGFSTTWAIVDAYLLLFRKFKDGAGDPMTRWI
jgi:hypothetical protein